MGRGETSRGAPHRSRARAEVARGEFYAALRRLHLDGASLRELAGAFGLSHQRVHQIVEAGGRSRRWRRRRGPCPDAVCSFCGREHSRGRTLVAGPGVHICEGCVGVVSGVVDTGRTGSTTRGPVRAVPDGNRRERCSFCGKRRHQVTALAATSVEAGGKFPGHASICAECLGVCREITGEQRA